MNKCVPLLGAKTFHLYGTARGSPAHSPLQVIQLDLDLGSLNNITSKAVEFVLWVGIVSHHRLFNTQEYTSTRHNGTLASVICFLTRSLDDCSVLICQLCHSTICYFRIIDTVLIVIINSQKGSPVNVDAFIIKFLTSASESTINDYLNICFNVTH